MFPFYKGYDFNLTLHQDDISAAQNLYGSKEPSFEPEVVSKLCIGNRTVDGNIDTIFGTTDGSYYVFKGEDYWKLTEDTVENGYPKKIRDDWPGLPNDIDAAFTWPDNNKTYFFKG